MPRLIYNVEGDNIFLDQIELPPTYKKKIKSISTIDMGIAVFIIGYYFYKYIVYTVYITEALRIGSSALVAQRELMLATLWAGIFTGHGLQLLMALVLYSAAKKRVADSALWKCRLWSRTSSSLIILILLELSVIFSMDLLRLNFLSFQCFLKLIFRIVSQFVVSGASEELRELFTQQIVELSSGIMSEIDENNQDPNLGGGSNGLDSNRNTVGEQESRESFKNFCLRVLEI